MMYNWTYKCNQLLLIAFINLGEQMRRLIALWLNIWRLNRKHNMIKRVNTFLLVRRIYPNVSGSFKKWYKCRYREIHIHQQIQKNTHFLVSFVLLSWEKVICIIRRHFEFCLRPPVWSGCFWCSFCPETRLCDSDDPTGFPLQLQPIQI